MVISDPKSTIVGLITKSLKVFRREKLSNSYVGELALLKLGESDLLRSGDPVDGIGVPLPSVVVVNVLSKPLLGDPDRLQKGKELFNKSNKDYW